MSMSSGRAPLEVGTRGTIGSLVKREIDYFTKLELERSSEDMASVGRSSWPSFRFSLSSWRRKKRRNCGIRPGMMADVSDSERLSQIPGFGYLNLKVDSQRYDV